MPLDTEKWNKRYLSDIGTIPEPALVLKDNSHLLPCHGDALDLACGLGGNAIFMARYGLNVSAWDFSTVAINRLNNYTKSHHLAIKPIIRDVSSQPPEPDSFDIIVVTHFLDRTITRSISEALKPNGLLFYQTYTQKKVANAGPTNPSFLLRENELLDLFKGLRVRVYREESNCGNTKKGLRDEALFIGEKL